MQWELPFHTAALRHFQHHLAFNLSVWRSGGGRGSGGKGGSGEGGLRVLEAGGGGGFFAEYLAARLPLWRVTRLVAVCCMDDVILGHVAWFGGVCGEHVWCAVKWCHAKNMNVVNKPTATLYLSNLRYPS